MGELLLRFLIGGVTVSCFAAVGEVFKPKTFAGMFGAAPSVALATLALAFANEDASYATREARSMMIGGVGLLVYCAACARVAERPEIPIWLGAGLCWIVWALVSFGLWGLVHFTTGIA